MSTLSRLLIATLVSLLCLTGGARAHEYQVGAIRIVHPWTRMPPAAAKVAGGFMTLTNTGTEIDRLIGGTIANAARFEVHEMAVVDGVMRMRQLQPGLEIKPGETVALKPGSYHVMFLDLTAAPAEGRRLKGTLVFEKAGTIEVEYKVEPAGAKTSGGHDHGAGSGSGSGSGAGAPKNANQ
jgi:periplasmic copper chaperone A